jgi:hypothetical protein
MRRVLISLVGIITYAGVASAAEEGTCAVAQHLAEVDAALPRVTAALGQNHALSIVVVGTSSSTLPGANGPQLAFPARLEAALAAKLQGSSIKVAVEAQSRRTAADMAETFPKLLETRKPNLVVWQTGTFDAIRGIETDSFSAALENGVRTLQEGGADVVLMNQQFSPRTEAMIATAAYADSMRWVALQQEIPLFDRAAVMRHWNELGTFDLQAATKKLDTAARVHDCIGRLLAKLITKAAKVNGVASGEQRQP